MIKKHQLSFLVCLCILLPSMLIAQTICQDSKGKNTVFLPGSSIGYELNEKLLTFSFNKEVQVKENVFLLGLAIKGSNKEGFTSVLNEGIQNTDTSISLLLGYQCDSGRRKIELAKNSFNNRLGELNGQIIKINEEINQIDRETVSDKFEKIFKKYTSGLDGYFITQLAARRLKYYQMPLDLIVELGKYAEANPQLQSIIRDITKEIYDKYNNPEKSTKEAERAVIQKELSGVREKLQSLAETSAWLKINTYVEFVSNPSKMNLFIQTESDNLADSFVGQKFWGKELNFGVNFNFNGGWILGGQFSLVKTNNIDEFELREYNLEDCLERFGQKRTYTKKINAYFSDKAYREYTQLNLNVDAVHFIPVNKIVLGWDVLYLRWSFYNDIDDVPETLTLGTGVSFFRNKGALLGGIFVEAPDISNARNSDKVWLNRLKIGLMLKLSASGFVLSK